MSASDPLLGADAEMLLAARRSIRAFLPQAVPVEAIAAVLRAAARAPSGNNIQPWRVHVVVGEVRDAIVSEVCAAWDAGDASHQAEYPYYPLEFFEPYLARRRRNGWGLYGLLGIEKGEHQRMHAQHRRNFEFFGAPVGLMFTIDRRLALGSWLDHGMFLQSVMLAACGQGLATCPQAAWNDYHSIIAARLGFAAEEQLVCGIALGYADPAAVENTLVTERAPLQQFVVTHGLPAV